MKAIGKMFLLKTEKDKLDLTKVKYLPDMPYEIGTVGSFLCILKTKGRKKMRWLIENNNGNLICRRLLDLLQRPNGSWDYWIDFDS